jgi:hypothetical protein
MDGADETKRPEAQAYHHIEGVVPKLLRKQAPARARLSTDATKGTCRHHALQYQVEIIDKR